MAFPLNILKQSHGHYDSENIHILVLIKSSILAFQIYEES